MITNSHGWRRILSYRTKKNRIFVPHYNRPSHINETISVLVKNGYMVWLDRDTVLPELRSTQFAGAELYDVYLLTPKGVRLCEENNIPCK
jgi:hypothetical protein